MLGRLDTRCTSTDPNAFAHCEDEDMNIGDVFPELEILRANPDDADVVSALAIRTMIETYPEQFGSEEAKRALEAEYAVDVIRREIQRDDMLFLLALWEKTPIGIAKLILNCPCEHLPDPRAVRFEKAYLIREHQSKGIGNHVFGALANELRSMGIQRAWLGVWEGNKAAISFHQRQGFRPVGTCEYRYMVGDEERVDTDIVMTIDLSAL